MINVKSETPQDLLEFGEIALKFLSLGFICSDKVYQHFWYGEILLVHDQNVIYVELLYQQYARLRFTNKYHTYNLFIANYHLGQ